MRVLIIAKKQPFLILKIIITTKQQVSFLRQFDLIRFFQRISTRIASYLNPHASLSFDIIAAVIHFLSFYCNSNSSRNIIIPSDSISHTPWRRLHKNACRLHTVNGRYFDKRQVYLTDSMQILSTFTILNRSFYLIQAGKQEHGQSQLPKTR